MMKHNLKDKKIALILPQKNFWDEEYNTVVEVLDQLSCELYIVANELNSCIGLQRTAVKPDLAVDDFQISDFDGVVIVGGPGSRNFLWENKTLHQKLSAIQNSPKPVLACSTSPVVLARSGVLTGKKATVYGDVNAVSIFDDHKVLYEKDPVVADGMVVTTNKPHVVREGLEKFLELFEK